MQNISALFGPWMIGFYSAIFLSAALLYAALPRARKKLGGAVLMAVFSVAGLLGVRLMGGAASGGLARFAELGARLLAVTAAINVAAVFFFSLVLPRLKAGVSKFVEDLILAGAYVLAGLAVVSASGADLSGVLATSAVVTGVVAFSLQDTLGNIIGGMVLHLEDTFRPGDWIGVDKYEGVVREVRWRQTTLENLDGDLVVVPNIILMKSTVTLLGRAAGNTRYRAVSFNVFYNHSPGEVTGPVEKALREDPPAGVAQAPAPYCAIKEFLPNCVAYEARYYLDDLFTPGRTDSSVRAKIFYALSRAGVKLSVLNRSLVVSEGAENAAEKSARDEAARRLAALRSVDVFQPLTPEEMETLASNLRQAPFSNGELITRQGAVADCLYIIYEGAAEVRLYSGGEDYRAVKELGPGSVLGEMGLLTGEPRSATAVASGEVRCYRLDRESFRGVLASRPEIAGAIAALLAGRRVELDAAKERLAGDAAAGRLRGDAQNLLAKIKSFFRL